MGRNKIKIKRIENKRDRKVSILIINDRILIINRLLFIKDEEAYLKRQWSYLFYVIVMLCL